VFCSKPQNRGSTQRRVVDAFRKSASPERTGKARERNMKAVQYVLALTLVTLASIFHVQAQTFPDRSITMVIPWPAGGGTDTSGRLFARSLEKVLGTTIIVENRPGASSAIGASYVARAKPDGYTLMFTTSGTVSLNPLISKDVSYKADDFEILSMVCAGDYLLVSGKQIPARTLAEFVALAKQQPGKLTLANTGIGTFSALLGTLIQSELKIEMVNVPYQGSGPAMIDTLKGVVDAATIGVETSLESIKSGNYVPFAIASNKRHPTLPDVPTFAELGFPSIFGQSAYGLYAPVGMPRDLAEKINAAVKQAQSDQVFKDRLASVGIEITMTSLAEARDYIAKDIARWKSVVESLNKPKPN
jgi:tripartite-type tricarboxylate transporter receptor subunit TctC